MDMPISEEIREKFIVNYQPIVDLNTGAVAGFEALTRIMGPGGVLETVGSRIEKIEVDAETFYILIRHILESIIRDLGSLFEKYPRFFISVNIPPAVLGSGRMKNMIQDLNLGSYTQRMVAELTERQALTDIGRKALNAARQQGIRIAVDDFGIGHSGIEQIAGLDFDILKIDHSLIAPALTSRISGRMIRGIVALAAALRLRTVAEGVETREQAFFMRAAGVDYGQGWYWSKARSPGALDEILEKGFGPDMALA